MTDDDKRAAPRFGPTINLQAATPELREKLRRQLNRIGGSEDVHVSTSDFSAQDTHAAPESQAPEKQLPAAQETDGLPENTSGTLHHSLERRKPCEEETNGGQADGKLVARHSLEQVPDGSLEDADAQDQDASDTDSEPLEYAMLSVAHHLPTQEVSDIFQKVARQEDRRMRLKKDRRMRLKKELHDRTVYESPERRPPSPSEQDRKDRSQRADGMEVGKEDMSRNLFPETSTHVRRSWRSLLLWPVLWAGFIYALVGCETFRVALQQIPWREMLPQHPTAAWTYELCRESQCNATTRSVTNCADVEIIEDRLQCFRLQANARNKWLGGLAQLVIYGIASVALLCLFLSLLCWRYLVGAAVAVLAGAVVFVLAIIAIDAAPVGLLDAGIHVSS